MILNITFRFYWLFYSLLLTVFLSACGGASKSSTTQEKPVIQSFTAQKSSASNLVKLMAVFTDGSGSIDHGVGSIQSGESIDVSPASDITYTLTVSNGSKTVTSNVNVVVDPFSLVIVSTREIYDEEKLFVVIGVDSDYELFSLNILLGGESQSISNNTYSSCPFSYVCFSGYISTKTLLSSNNYTLKAVVEDAKGNVASNEKPYIVNRPPSLTLSEPQSGNLVGSQLPLNIACNDDHGDCDISFSIEEYLWYSFDKYTVKNTFNKTLDLSDFDGKKIMLNVIATDKFGLKTRKPITLYIESSTELTLLKNYSGEVVDFDGIRVLVKKEDQNSKDYLVIERLDSSEVVTVEMPSDPLIDKVELAYLTPTGALYSTRKKGEARSESIRLFDWNNATLHQLVDTDQFRSVQVAGNFVGWFENDKIKYRTFTTGTTLEISPIYQDDFRKQLAIGDNGVLLYVSDITSSTGDTIEKYENGMVSELVRYEHEIFFIKTDGLHFLYMGREENGTELRYNDGVNEHLLSSEFVPDYIQSDSKIDNAWVAFSKIGSQGQREIWVRKPDGTLMKRTSFLTDSNIEDISSDGDLTFFHDKKRYLNDADGNTTQISYLWGSASRSRSIKINDAWYLMVGSSLLNINK